MGHTAPSTILLVESDIAKATDTATRLQAFLGGFRIETVCSEALLLERLAEQSDGAYACIVLPSSAHNDTVRDMIAKIRRYDAGVPVIGTSDNRGFPADDTANPRTTKACGKSSCSEAVLADRIRRAISKPPCHGPSSRVDDRAALMMLLEGQRGATCDSRPTPETYLNARAVHHAVMAAMDQGVIVTDHRGRILYANARLLDIVGASVDNTVGNDVASLLAGAADRLAWEQMTDVDDGRGIAEIEVNLVGDGIPVSVQVTRIRVALATGPDSAPKAVYLVEDLTTLRSREAVIVSQELRLHEMSVADGLTGLANRRGFNAAASVAWARRRNPRESLACVMIEVDHFGKVNGEYGRATGDEILRGLADVVGPYVDKIATVARYGCGELAILLPKTGARDACLWAENVRGRIESMRFSIRGHIHRVTVSVGIGVTSGGLSGPGELICRSSLALQDAKRKGRNRCSLWKPTSVADILAEAHADDSPDHAMRQCSIEIEPPSGGMDSRMAITMAQAMSDKDQATSSHCMWVGWLAAEVGRRLGMDQARVEELHTAGVLHDVGKLGVPSAILLKPGPLSDHERQLVDCHTRIGADLVARHRGSERLQTAIRCHHDWYDGSRNVSGTATKDLPRYARILSATDAYQSMIEERPYRAPRTSEQAVDELRKYSGTQFDPEIVEALAEIITPRGRCESPFLGAVSATKATPDMD